MGAESASAGADRTDDPGNALDGFGFPRASRIRKGTEIRSLFGRGKRNRTAHLDVFHAPSPVSHARWGSVVPKYGRSAVERNRLKRRLREIGRTRVLPMLRTRGRPVDMLVRARREAYGASFQVLREELMEVTESLCSGRFS